MRIEVAGKGLINSIAPAMRRFLLQAALVLSMAGSGVKGRSIFRLEMGKMTMASGNDMKAAQSTYESFVGVIKVATPVIAVIAAVVIYLLAH